MFRKGLVGVLGLLLWTGVMGHWGIAAAAAPVTVSLGDVIADAGATSVVVPVNVSEGHNIAGFEFTVIFDPDVIRVTGAESGDLTSGWRVISRTETKGEIRVAGFDPALTGSLQGSGSQAKLIFEVRGSPGESTALLFTGHKLANPLGATISSTAVGGTFTVSSLPLQERPIFGEALPTLDFPGDQEVYLINPVTRIPPTLEITNLGELGEITRAKLFIWEIEDGERNKKMVAEWTPHLERLTLPHGILQPGINYEAQVVVMNEDGVTVTSDSFIFRTVASAGTDDEDNDGIPDEQEIDGFVDMDGDRDDDRIPGDHIAALRNVMTDINTAVQIVRYKGVTPRVARVEILDAYGLASPLGYRFSEGVFSFRIEGLTPGSWVHVKFHLSEPFQKGDRWWKYDTIHGWQIYATAGEVGGRIIAGVGTNQVTLKFVDGGYGDADGVANSVIVDPGGPGRRIQPQAADCFIATAAFGTSLAGEVEVLRRFRDEHLLTQSLGRIIVINYEKISPSLAEFIRREPILRKGVRVILRPLIWMSRKVTE